MSIPPNTEDQTTKVATLPSLTSLRFFAAFAVFLFHVTLSSSPLPPHGPINPFADSTIAQTLESLFGQFGYIGVSFFFILSGFVITWATPDRFSVKRFFWRRLMKIYPPHIVVWAISLLLFAGAYTTPQTALLNLTLFHPFSPDPTVYVSVNPPAWSLSSDLFFYILFPFLAPLVRSIPEDWIGRSIGLVVLGMFAVILITTYIVPSEPKSPISPISGAQFWFNYIFPASRMLEFFLGMFGARLLMSGRWRRIDLMSSGLALVASVLIAKQLPFLYTFGICYVLPLLAIITECAALDREGKTPKWLGDALMLWLGRVSFGFYLVQGLSIFWLSKALGLQNLSMAGGIGAILLFFCMSMVGGWLLYRFVEEPAMKMTRRLSQARVLRQSA
ncbi:MAG: acyltransferase [Pseudoruegeria sp.]